MKDILRSGFDNQYKELKSFHYGLIKDSQGIPELQEEEWFSALDYMRKLTITDTEVFVNDHLSRGANVLAEGAQGALLDVNFGTYPFVTSSNTIASAGCVGLGIGPREVRDIYGVFKAYTTRVGEGPFLTELSDDTGISLMQTGREYGSTTGRPRRCGWLDLVALKYSIMLNGANKLVITKPDILNCVDEIKVCTQYKDHQGRIFNFTDAEQMDLLPTYDTLQSWKEDISPVNSFENLPLQTRNYLAYIEKQLSLKINIISVGPDRIQTIKR